MKKFLAALAALLVLAPAAAFASGGRFVDDEQSIFEPSIEWLADAGVTVGCNPPDNDRFCPTDNVTRGQMAAFMQRFAAFLGAEDGVVSSADDAASVGGVPAGSLVTHDEIVMTHSTSTLTANEANPPSSLQAFASGNIVSGDGAVMIALTGPASLGGVSYGLQSIEYCIENPSGGAYVDIVRVDEEGPFQGGVFDGTDRPDDGCYSLDVNRSGSSGYAITLTVAGGAGASLRVSGATSTWAPTTALGAAAAEGGAPTTAGRN